jgi:hypothetical protein
LHKIGYTQEYGERFQYSPADDSLEYAYEVKYLRKYGVDKYRKSFVDVPTIKDTMHIEIGFDQPPSNSTRKNASNFCKDTIDVYLNNELISTGEYPMQRACWIYYKYLPMQVHCTYKNRKRLSKAQLLIVFHDHKVYYDTIIPLRFKYMHIGHPLVGFNTLFKKALD